MRKFQETLTMIAVAALVSATASAQIVNPANGHTYVTTPYAMTIEQARAYAASVCGYLVAINDAAEQTFVVTNFNSIGAYWIGLSDEMSEGVYAWDSGEPFAYANWCAGEPNNFYLEDWVTYEPSCAGGGTPGWNDVWPYNSSHGIIEIPAALPGAGPGETNSDAATLTVNGNGCGASGPHTVYLPDADPPLLTLTWRGPANVPYVLFSGPANPAGAFIPCVGSVDVGTAALGFSDVTFIFNGFASALYTTGSDGLAQQTISLPAILPTGPFLEIQGAIGQPAGCPVKLTAAFSLEG